MAERATPLYINPAPSNAGIKQVVRTEVAKNILMSPGHVAIPVNEMPGRRAQVTIAMTSEQNHR